MTDDTTAEEKSTEDSTKPEDTSTDTEKPEETPVVDDGKGPEGEVKVPDTKKTEDTKDEDTLLEDEEEKISKVVKKHLSGFVDELSGQRIDSEVNKILTENPEYKPYEARIRRFVDSPNRKEYIKAGLPVKAVIMEAIAPYLEQIGANKRKLADEKAKITGGGGSTTQPASDKGRDWSTVPSKDITLIAEQIKAGIYKPPVK